MIDRRSIILIERDRDTVLPFVPSITSHIIHSLYLTNVYWVPTMGFQC